METVLFFAIPLLVADGCVVASGAAVRRFRGGQFGRRLRFSVGLFLFYWPICSLLLVLISAVGAVYSLFIVRVAVPFFIGGLLARIGLTLTGAVVAVADYARAVEPDDCAVRSEDPSAD